MRILLVDIDALRPDHLGCYGYHRKTSPTIDRLAAGGTRFTRCYTPDAPCLPSRTAMVTGRFGIHTGVVNHGGTAAEPFRVGPARAFRTTPDRYTLFEALRYQGGMHTVSFSPFPHRHAAWHFVAGLAEFHDTGGFGDELGDVVNAQTLPWLEAHAQEDNWCVHLNYWDAHRPYRTPDSFGNPFADDPPPAWYNEDIRRKHWEGCGLQCAREPNDGSDRSEYATLPGRRFPLMPDTIGSMADYQTWIDGYDTGIRCADRHLGEVIGALERAGVLDDTLIVITADHGENQGELNHYGAHRTGDEITHHIPMIVRWPGRVAAGAVFEGLCYHLDVGATILDLAGLPRPALWDGRSLKSALIGTASQPGRDYLVLSQLAYMAQRSVRFDDWIVIRTWHDGFSNFPEVMVYDLKNDPHELRDLAGERPDIAQRGLALLEQWRDEALRTRSGVDAIDPLETTLREGPHTMAEVKGPYVARLRRTGRGHLADEIERRHGK